MRKDQAKRLACAVAAGFLKAARETIWFHTRAHIGRPLNDEETSKATEAFDDLVDELERRGIGQRRLRG